MGGKLIDEGANYISSVAIKNTAQRSADSLYIGLYEDTTEPGVDITLATITEVTVANGYARINILESETTVDSAGEITVVQKTFTASGADWDPFYGYFICDVASGTSGLIYFLEHITIGPITVLDGLDFKITPTITPSFIP